jgi:hypothetical protein
MFSGISKYRVYSLLAVIIAPILIWGFLSSAATTYTVTFQRLNSGGTITGTGINCKSGEGSDCTHSYSYSTSSYAYTAASYSGYSFRGWDTNGDGTVDSTANPLNVSRTKSWNITAVWKRYTQFIVDPSNRSGGYVKGTQVDCPTDCHIFYDSGTTSYSYQAYPASGYKFRGWDIGNNGSIDSTSSTISIKADGSRIIKATFSKPVAPTCALKPSASSVYIGSPVTISWSSTNATSTAATSPAGWSGTTSTSGSKTLNPASTTTYAMSVTGPDGNSSCITTVTVSSPPPTTTAPKTPAPKTTTPKTPVKSPAPTTTSTAPSPAPTDTEPPSVPQNLSGNYYPEKSAAILEWSASKDNVGVLGYEIARSEKGVLEWRTINRNQTSLKYSDIEVGTEKTYEYRVRAYDEKNNFSDWSESIVLSTGPFQPNVTKKEGGIVENEDATVLVEVQASAVKEDLFISIEPVELIKLRFPKGFRLVGSTYEIRAKNRNGEEVTKFESPIIIKYLLTESEKEQINTKTLKLAFTKDNLTTEEVKSVFEKDVSMVSAQVGHLTPYYVIAKNKSGFWAFLKNLSIGALALAAISAPFVYLYYRKLQKQKNYEEIQNELKY